MPATRSAPTVSREMTNWTRTSKPTNGHYLPTAVRRSRSGSQDSFRSSNGSAWGKSFDDDYAKTFGRGTNGGGEPRRSSADYRYIIDGLWIGGFSNRELICNF